MSINPQHIRDGLINMIEALGPSILLTVVFPTRTSLRSGEAAAVELLKRIERKAHGRDWYNFPDDQRLRALGFPENLTSNFHFHIPVAGPPEVQAAILEHGEETWRTLTKTGHIDIQVIRSVAAVSRYVTKQNYGEHALERFFVYGPRVL